MNTLALVDDGGAELVPVEAVQDLLGVVQAGLEELQTQVERAEAEASEAEAHQRVLLHVPSFPEGRTALLRSALSHLAALGDDQQDASLAAAEAHAAARIAAAQAEADDIVLRAHVERAHRLVRPSEPDAPVPPAVRPPMQPAALVARARRAASAEAPALAASAAAAPDHAETWSAPDLPAPAAGDVAVEAEDEEFVEFWRIGEDAARSAEGDGLTTILVGMVGALIAIVVLLVLVG